MLDFLKKIYPPKSEEAERRIATVLKKKGAQLPLGYLHLRTLPDSIGQLTQQLRSLILGSNQLTTLPDSIGQLTQLQRLDLGSNQFTTLPASIIQLT